jgi:RNA polymerase sigma-70 factor (ECF subfamily)
MRSPAGYAYQIALNLQRSRLRRLRVHGAGLDIQETALDPYGAADLRVDLGKALRRLPAKLREALFLVDYLGLESETAGKLLGINPSSVRVRVHRARLALREGMEET